MTKIMQADFLVVLMCQTQHHWMVNSRC